MILPYTLTYHRVLPGPARAKVQLQNFCDRFEREFGFRPLSWTLEPQKRGAPHFHLITFLKSAAELTRYREWAPVAWNDIAGAGSVDHLRWHRGECGNANEHCVQPIREGFGGVVKYASKYCSKPPECDPGWQWPGRFWGILHEKILPIAMDRFEVPDDLAYAFKRFLKRHFEHVPSSVYRIEHRRADGGREVARVDPRQLPVVDRAFVPGVGVTGGRCVTRYHLGRRGSRCRPGGGRSSSGNPMMVMMSQGGFRSQLPADLARQLLLLAYAQVFDEPPVRLLGRVRVDRLSRRAVPGGREHLRRERVLLMDFGPVFEKGDNTAAANLSE